MNHFLKFLCLFILPLVGTAQDTVFNISPSMFDKTGQFFNAFYSVCTKKKSGKQNYEPTVCVRTKRTKDHIEISVADNGDGIPARLLNKIFQPFFTTKPRGQGTGLGLSLSYDIIKSQGGELKVKSTEGEGAEFIICLLLNGS